MKILLSCVALIFLITFVIAAPHDKATENEARINTNPDNPLILDEYGAISTVEESVRIGIAVDWLRKLEGVKALFLIGYGPKDTKRAVRKRINRIESILLNKHKLPRDLFQFVFDEKPKDRFTRIYAWPKTLAPNSYWIADIEI